MTTLAGNRAHVAGGQYTGGRRKGVVLAQVELRCTPA